ncbi:Na+:solute symporter [candidate division KSB1 bacterium]|nr:Na+:solute symporter [candidate division KSB1 bacterium]
MNLATIDIVIIVAYLVLTTIAGLVLAKVSSKNIKSYFLGGNRVPWYLLGVANASGMFDITGTMMIVTWTFVYGMKGAFVPWVWPVFNQVFLMVFLSVWLRRSNVMTGAEWIRTRFGNEKGAKLSDISVVIFALISTIAFLAYAFQGIGKFSQIFLPWDLTPATYAIIIMGITSVYTVLGGMFGVLVSDILQFTIMTISSFAIAAVAMSRTSAAQINAVIPDGWRSLAFGWKFDLDWSQTIPAVNERIISDGWSLFTIFMMMVFIKGFLISMAGPAPNYDMQRILATKSPKEAGLMSWFVTVVLMFPRYLMVSGIVVLGLVFFRTDLVAMGSAVDFEQILPFVLNKFIPAGMAGLVIAGLLSAFMSTFSGTVNCGASYIVNDIYRRYISSNSPAKRYVWMSYLASIVLVAVGIGFGYMIESIHTITQWIVGGLWGGYTAPNVLKWYWWRFNGRGYFGGMVAGMATAIAIPVLFPNTNLLFGLELNLAVFPAILGVSAAASIIISLLTPPDDEKILMRFYKTVRPWGFWKPIREKVIAQDAHFMPNRRFKRDMVNVLVGIVWQLMLMIIPVYLVIKDFSSVGLTAVFLLVTSIFLKFNWYDKMEKE